MFLLSNICIVKQIIMGSCGRDELSRQFYSDRLGASCCAAKQLNEGFHLSGTQLHIRAASLNHKSQIFIWCFHFHYHYAKKIPYLTQQVEESGFATRADFRGTIQVTRFEAIFVVTAEPTGHSLSKDQ